MYEHRSEKIIPRAAFAKRLLGAFLITVVIVVGSLLVGACGYHWFGEIPWGEAFHHTCLMLSGHNNNWTEYVENAPVFNGLFVLYGRLVFVSLVAIFLAPLLHRILHRLHLEDVGKKEED